jgi:hypothetical protein
MLTPCEHPEISENGVCLICGAKIGIDVEEGYYDYCDC